MRAPRFPSGFPRAHRRLRTDRRHSDRRARRPRWLDRLALHAAVRFTGVLRRARRRPHERSVADRPGFLTSKDEASIPRSLARPRDRLHDRDRNREADRLHAAAAERSGSRTNRRRAARRSPDADGARDPIRLRIHRAVGTTGRRRASRHRRPGRLVVVDADRDPRRRFDDARGVYGQRGRARTVRHGVAPIPSHPSANRRRGRCRGNLRVVEGMGRALRLSTAPGATRSCSR